MDSRLAPFSNLSFSQIRAGLLMLLVFAIGWGFSYWMLSSIAGFVGTDDYYHSRISAQIIAQGRLGLHFPWLPLTVLNPEAFVDHHLLYHLYLAPWMYWGGVTGVKIAHSFIIAGIGLAFYALLKTLNVRNPHIWTLGLLALSVPFLYRMLMIRTQAAAVLLLLLTLHVLFTGRYAWLLLLSFAFTWLYNGFILLPAIVVLYSIAQAINTRRIIWSPILFAALGLVLGIIINPYFPENLAFISNHLGEKVNLASSIPVGGEWYPYNTSELLENSLGAFLALGLGLLAGSFRKEGRDTVETTALLVALLTLYMLFQSRRFIEYFPNFALLFCALAWGRGGIEWDRILPSTLLRSPLARLQSLAAAGIILALSVFVLKDLDRDFQASKSFDFMAGAGQWLEDHTEQGEMVFQMDWDDFPQLFYHNTHNVYLVGLDPTYLQVANPMLWNQWVAITQGRVEQPSNVIQELFGARFVVSDTEHRAFAEQAENDPAMQLVYRDEYSLIWQIHETE